MSKNLVRYEIDLGNPPALTKRQKAELTALSLRVKVDCSDIPELSDEELENTIPRRLYKPTKSVATVRVDTDVLEWLKSSGKGYQTRINTILRDAMIRSVKHP